MPDASISYAPALLGHTGAETMEKHYFIAQGQIAIETYHELDRRSRRRGEAVEGMKTEAEISFARKVKAFVVSSSVSGTVRRSRRAPGS